MNDSHPAELFMQEFKQRLNDYNIPTTGVIHVGARDGAEIDFYAGLGFKNLLFIEPNPELFRKLENSARNHPTLRIIIVPGIASNRPGVAQFHSYNNPSYDSVLSVNLSKCQELNLHKLSSTPVTTHQIDEVISAHRFTNDDFSYLHLTSQGLEGLALSGATSLLHSGSLQGIYCEVCLDTIYDNQTQYTALENHLKSRGFNRCSINPQTTDKISQPTLYVKKHVVSMGSLGTIGRFGNHLFQYAFAKLVAQRQGAILQTSRWKGSEIFNLDDPAPCIFPTECIVEVHSNITTRNIPKTRILSEAYKLIQFKDDSINNVDLLGYFQFHTSYYKPYQSQIRELFRLRSDILEKFESVINEILSSKKTLVALHLRRGDHGHKQFYRAPCSWFESWLEKQKLQPSDCAIYICSEDPLPYIKRFAPFSVYSYKDFEVPAELESILDFYVLTQANTVAISACSSFSHMACLLNTHAENFYRADIITRSIINFNPWNCLTIEPNIALTSEEHRKLEEID